MTLAKALAWLGHDCPGGCPRGATEMSTRMRFLHLPGAGPPFWPHTVVVVDPSEIPSTATHLHGWLHDVNHCVRRDHIIVRTRVASDAGIHSPVVPLDVHRPPRLGESA